jgi:hypothetical protein
MYLSCWIIIYQIGFYELVGLLVYLVLGGALDGAPELPASPSLIVRLSRTWSLFFNNQASQNWATS